MAGLQSGECRMMIDSVVWAQYINVTDSHVVTANAALTQYASGGKNITTPLLLRGLQKLTMHLLRLR